MKGPLRFLLWALLLLAPACGSDLVWFVSWNTGDIEEGGLVVVIGTPHSQPLKSVELIEGEIPAGMHVESDGTVQGVPEEAGHFDFTLRLTETSGRVLQKSYSVEVDSESVQR
ncbi:MAG TPA: putative Ig domain-containing protein [bacterium]|nr:putative Ig domain-containing protein [bacterium]